RHGDQLQQPPAHARDPDADRRPAQVRRLGRHDPVRLLRPGRAKRRCAQALQLLQVQQREEDVVSSLLSGPPAPTLRKPASDLSFGSGSSDDWARALAEVSVEAGLAPAVDAASVVLAARDDAPAVALDDTGSVSLGFEDDATVGVFKGAVRAVNRTVAG